MSNIKEMITLYMDGSPITAAENTTWGLNFLRETFDHNRSVFPYTWERGIIRADKGKVVWDSQAENVASIIDAEIWND
tara:strand:+ start:346 stop:579 length:234 start_codon:yes stop_codon:yes gene_type:complete